MAIKCCDSCGWVEEPNQCKNPDICRWRKGGCTGWKPEKEQPMTNADRIRSMTDEELAEWGARCEIKAYEWLAKEECLRITCDKKQITEDWLDWLKQEVKNG